MTRRTIILLLLLAAAATLSAQSRQTRQKFYSPQPTGTILPQPVLVPQGAAPVPAATAAQPVQPAAETAAAAADDPLHNPVRGFDWKEFSPHFSVGGDFRSRYVQDGWVVNDRPVSTLQLEMTESGGYAGLFGVYDYNTRRDTHWNFAEYRGYVGYAARCLNSGPFGPVTVDAGWCYKYYPASSGTSSGEIYLETRLDDLYVAERWRITTGAALLQNYNERQTTLRFSAGHFWQVLDEGKLGLSNRLLLYWGDGSKVRSILHDESGNMFYSLGWQTQLRWKLCSFLTITPYAGILLYPDKRAERAARASDLDSSFALHTGAALEWNY